MTKILVIDDDVHATTLLERILALNGYQATGVTDSSLAMKTAKEIVPDLVLLDLMMPEPNGFQVCQMLRDDPNFKETPIIITTALGDYESKDKAYAAGASDYMVKPLHMDALLKTIETQLK